MLRWDRRGLLLLDKVRVEYLTILDVGLGVIVKKNTAKTVDIWAKVWVIQLILILSMLELLLFLDWIQI